MNASLKIDISDAVCVPRALLVELSRRIRRAATRLKISAEQFDGLAVRIVGDKEMSELHEQFMGEKKPTDVLSFPAGDAVDDVDFGDFEGELDDDGPEDAFPFSGGLGDIILDWDVICRQASAATQDARLHEATILSVHGLVHLLGHDHRTRREGREMHRLERIALRALRVPDIPRPYTTHV